MFLNKFKSFFAKFGKKLVILLFLIIILLGICFFIFTYGFNYTDIFNRKLTIGFITDIHAGNTELRQKGSVFITCANFKENINKALNKFKKDDYIIALGDNIDKRGNCEKYATTLKETTKNFNIKWVKGNHDKDDCFNKLSDEEYYYFEDKNWRIIVLDNSNWYPKEQRNSPLIDDPIGLIDSKQMEWFKNNALNTDKKILIAMHVPMFNDIGNGEFILRKDYIDFKNIIEKNENVKYILSGHYHNENWSKTENGITYFIIPSVSLQNNEGFYFNLELD